MLLHKGDYDLQNTTHPAAPTRAGGTGEIALRPSRNRVGVRGIIPDLGANATKRFLEFFTANIRNNNTLTAFVQAVAQFLRCCKAKGGALKHTEPIHGAAYVELLQRRADKPLAAPSVKQHLASVLTLFDRLVVGHVIGHRPAASVRGPEHAVKKGKTPVPSSEDARKLLDSIPLRFP